MRHPRAVSQHDISTPLTPRFTLQTLFFLDQIGSGYAVTRHHGHQSSSSRSRRAVPALTRSDVAAVCFQRTRDQQTRAALSIFRPPPNGCWCQGELLLGAPAGPSRSAPLHQELLESHRNGRQLLLSKFYSVTETRLKTDAMSDYYTVTVAHVHTARSKVTVQL